MLSVTDSIEDRVKGLDLGADDYLIKPFAFEELLARIRVMMRRKPQLDVYKRQKYYTLKGEKMDEITRKVNEMHAKKQTA